MSNSGTPYGIPATNPYVGVAGADEIWAMGLRNPWKFSFDRTTGVFMDCRCRTKSLRRSKSRRIDRKRFQLRLALL